jgi:membrane peptidoglycan carboxypeptidase
VFSPETSWLVMDMLSDPEARHPRLRMELPFDLPFRVAAKTGTARGFADTWAVAATREVVAGAWAGAFDGRPTQGIVGMDAAAPRRPRASRALRDLGHGPGPHCPRVHDYAVHGRAPAAPCSWHDDTGRLHYPDRAKHWLARRR